MLARIVFFSGSGPPDAGDYSSHRPAASVATYQLCSSISLADEDDARRKSSSLSQLVVSLLGGFSSRAIILLNASSFLATEALRIYSSVLAFSLPRSSLYFNEISEEGKQALHAMRKEKDGIKVLIFLTMGADVSDYWAIILNVVQKNLPVWDRDRVRRHLSLLLEDLQSSRRQTVNPWKKAKFIRVEKEVKRMLADLQEETL